MIFLIVKFHHFNFIWALFFFAFIWFPFFSFLFKFAISFVVVHSVGVLLNIKFTSCPYSIYYVLSFGESYYANELSRKSTWHDIWAFNNFSRLHFLIHHMCVIAPHDAPLSIWKDREKNENRELQSYQVHQNVIEFRITSQIWRIRHQLKWKKKTVSNVIVFFVDLFHFLCNDVAIPITCIS